MKMADKVVIGMVNDGSIASELVIDLLQIRGKRMDKFDSFIQVSNIGLLTRSRNVLVKNFLEQTDAEWLLMFDADQRLSLETWDLLVQTAHHKDRPVVSGLVFAAFQDDNDNLRPVPTIYRMTEYGLQCLDGYPKNEVVEIDAAGTGCLLIHRNILLQLQEHATENQGKNWSWFVDGAIAGTWFGEDLLFSKRLRSLGIPIHAHTGAICAHKKTYWLTDEHHEPLREQTLKELKQEG